ncbi:uncharacterized protein LDX57_008712 [Aspergillus melleus]|uniref:uncharacterized protein n=1 Tax=Aspergillus melleus TaxID=138277 RepID=UPI001E8EE931|nr:uncharacterized protein LDX57_008712 [Aspergillus melleus]KAH8431051.1 hypothetical protein LDX57_008712 [Aspergillus melleus]
MHLELVAQQIDALVVAIIANPSELVRDLTRHFPEGLLSLYTPSVSERLEQAPKLSPYHWVDHWAKTNSSWPALEVIESINDDVIKSRTWSYEELARKSNHISSWLAARGWRNSTIGVCLGRSFMAYAIVLAIWKSGNCYIPIAEDLPEARRVLLLSDSGATALFSDKEALGDVVPPEGCEVIDINSVTFHDGINSIDETVEVDVNPSDNCYLLYTSGSTGLPKGVIVTRGNLSAFTEAQSEYICRHVPDTLTLGGKGSYLAHASRAFDVHICEMVLGWRHGLRLVTAPRTMLLDNLRLVLTQCRISHAGFVPSLLEHTGISAEQLPDLRYLGVGGEKISETIIERFVGKPLIAVVNAYGPTEVTIGLTSHTVTASSTVRNIGSAVGNITLHVLVPGTNDYVKRGQAGELCVTGDLVAKGYHGRPDAKGFVNFQGQHMYRTGDIVRLMANNCVEYLGRRDSQAKVRGQRLELEEVSIAVRRCADREVNVTSIVTPSPITKRPQLITFISPSSGRPEDVSRQPEFIREEYQRWIPQVLERCRQQLPVYMVPSVLLPVNFIPVQISGKADNRRLAALYESIPPSDLLHEPNGSTVAIPGLGAEQEDDRLTADEQQVCDIVCSIASADPKPVTKSTSIFQLGIDSLSSLNLAVQMRKSGYVCSAADILRNNTIVQLAALPRCHDISGKDFQGHVSEEQFAEATQQLLCVDYEFRQLQKPILNSSIAVVRPSLPLQESLVSISMDSSAPLYVNHIMFRLQPAISLEALILAFEDLFQENEIFRTCFSILNDRVVQVVLKPRVAQIALDQVTVSDEEAARGFFTKRQAYVASSIISGLEIQPPIRLITASSADSSHPGWLMLSIHHSIFDGASIDMLLNRLYDHYSGETPINCIDLTPLYCHFMTATAEEAEKYWVRYLADCRPAIALTENTSATPYRIITKKLPFKLAELSSLASKISTTTPLVLETIWGIALAKLLGQADVIFGRVMNGRSIPVDLVEKMLVPLVATVPTRLRLSSGAESLVGLIRTQTQASLESLPHQHTPLRAIQRYAQAPGPLFNSMFSYIATGPSAADRLLQEIDSVMEVDYPLALEVRADKETDAVTLRLRVVSDPSLTENAESMISTILILLQSLLSNEDAIIHEPELVRSQEREQQTWDENHWTEDEIAIRQLVCQITGLPESQISKNISFFALGIDSVISIRLARSLREWGLQVSSSDILKYASVGSLYNHVQIPSNPPSVPKLAETTLNLNADISLFNADDSIEEVYRCTPLQTAMIGQCLSSQGKDYVHHHVVTLEDSIDLDRLQCAWEELAEQADILRTSFHRPESSHGFIAAVHKYPLVEWSHCPEEASFARAIKQLSEQTTYPEMKHFHKPPWSVTILQKGFQRLMAVSMHHCLYDGFSLPLLFGSLEKIYQGLKITIGTFASAARTIAYIQENSSQLWINMVTGYQSAGLPASPDSHLGSRAQWAEVKVQTPVIDLLRQCGSLEVTLQTVALLAYGRSLALLLGQRDVVFGHVVSGRALDVDVTAPLIGPLLNTVPFRLTLDPILRSTRSVLKHIQQFCAESLHHQHVSLSEVQNAWRVRSRSASLALLDALFTFNKTETTDTTSIFQPYHSDQEPSSPHYKLNVEFEQTPESLFIRVSCRDLFNGQGELQGWLESLAQNIADIVASPDAPVLSFPANLGALPLHTSPLETLTEEGTDASDSAHHIEMIKEILGRVTGTPVEQIQTNSSIFALGVDSILAIDISARCRDSGLQLSVADVIQGKTVQGISSLAAKRLLTSSEPAVTVTAPKFIVDSQSKAKALEALCLTDAEVEIILPCLSGQLFYISRWLESGCRLWEFTFAFKSRVRLDEEQFKHAWNLLQQRHGILRTSFAAVSRSEVVQVVFKPAKSGRDVLVDSQLHAENIQNILRDLFQDTAAAPSNLLTPPARIRLVQCHDNDVILLTLHHALYDAWSIPILVKDLEALYINAPLPEPTEFSSFIHHAQRKPDLYWSTALSNASPTVLGSNVFSASSSLDIKSSHGLFPQILRKVEALCRQKGTSMPTLILLALSRSLARIADATNPTFGLFQAGRSNDFPEIHSIAGPTVNMLPFVVQDVLSCPVSECAQAIQRDLDDRTRHDQTDLRQLLKTYGSELQFNVLVNIVWGKLESGTSHESGDSIFTPFAIDIDDGIINGQAYSGETSVDALDCDELPCKSNAMLEVRHSEADDALVWQIDYTLDLMSVHEAENFLGVLEKEVEEVVASL